MKVSVEADGGSRGNPGPAGYGAVLRSADGTVLAERAGYLGITTNNVAEYQGLIAGLRAAVGFGATAVEARLDSKLVVEQMSGRWKVKHPALRPLADEARGLVAELGGRVTFTWIPRARNTYADSLANKAMDIRADIRRDLVPADPTGGNQPSVVPAPERNTVTPVRERLTSPSEPGEPSLFDIEPDRGSPRPTSWGPTARDRVPAPPPGGSTTVRDRTAGPDTATRLVLVRHGQTPLSVERRYSGHGDPDLTGFGRGQAEALARRLATHTGVTAVYSSPLARAGSTAGAVAGALGLPVTVHPGFIETDFGAWEGLTFTEAAGRDPGTHRRWLSDPETSPPGGESFAEVTTRVDKAVSDLLTDHHGETVIVVTHVTPVKCVVRRALAAGPEVLYRTRLDLASISVTEFYPDGNAVLRLFNDTAHLDQVGAD